MRQLDNPIFRMVMMNAVSDALWAYLSATGLTAKFEHTNQINYSLNGQLTAQVVHPTLGAAFAGFGMLLAYKYGIQKEPPTLEIFSLCAVTPAVIAMWNFAQPKAVELFKSLGYSLESAGYLSSIFTGLSEGSTSYVLTKLIRLLAQSREYSKFRTNPQQYLGDYFLKLGLNVTIGAISGAVWQLVFNALTIANVGALVTSLAVVLSAAIATTGSLIAINKIVNSNAYHACLDLCAASDDDEKSDDPQFQHEAPIQRCFGPCMSFWGGLFGSGAMTKSNELGDLSVSDTASSMSTLGSSPQSSGWMSRQSSLPASAQASGTQESLLSGCPA